MNEERGSREAVTKSVAHSAIVYTLTVVKAVRAVGYATLDVAAQCRAAAKRNPDAVSCAEHAVTAMSLGLEALNSALSWNPLAPQFFEFGGIFQVAYELSLAEAGDFHRRT
eukprot:symbB.v1.2.039828.t1/scaffold6811.1/size15374/2